MVKRCCYVKAWRRRWLYFISEFSYCKSVRLSWAIFTKGESRGEHVNMKNFDQDVFGTSLLYGIVATLSVSLAKETSFVRVVHHTIHWTLNLSSMPHLKVVSEVFSLSEWHRISWRKEKVFSIFNDKEKNYVIEIIHWCQVFETFEDITVFRAPLSRLERCVKRNCRSLES